MVVWWLWSGVSLASPPPSDATEAQAAEEAVAPEPPAGSGREWFPFLLPAVAFNTTDGLGVGLGGEVYARPAAWDYGYRWKVSGGLWGTLGLRYQSHYLKFDVREDRASYVGVVGYRRWTDFLYAGQGGHDVHLDHGAAEDGNLAVGPYAFVGFARHQPGRSWSPYVQVYARRVHIEPSAGGVLDGDLPAGAFGGLYVDTTLGVEVLDTDRWPIPTRGWRADLAGAVGLSAPRPINGFPLGPRPVGDLHLDVTRWVPVYGPRLVVAGRILADHALGERPFFEKEVMGGRWRDEVGSDQALAGYGRTRTRGDGLLTLMIEVRPYVGTLRRGWFDLAAYASLFVEDGFLFEGIRPGPHLPTVGAGPLLVWQSALQFRPFVAWGWRSDDADDPRRPVPQFGISFQDPL